MEEYFTARLHCLGYGNPRKAKIFIFGIEEKLDEKNNSGAKCLEQVYIKKNKSANRNAFCLTNEEIYESCPGIKQKLEEAAQKSKFYNQLTEIYNKLFSESQIEPKQIGSGATKLFYGNLHYIDRIGTNYPYLEEEVEFIKNNSNKKNRIIN